MVRRKGAFRAEPRGEEWAALNEASELSGEDYLIGALAGAGAVLVFVMALLGAVAMLDKVVGFWVTAARCCSSSAKRVVVVACA